MVHCVVQVVLLTPDTQLGSILGELLATAPHSVYWDRPFRPCWRQPHTCRCQG